MTPGIYDGLTYEQYEAAGGISKHGLDALAISPLHYWAWNVNPERPKRKETPAKALGSAIHVAILEPERFEKEYVREPDKEELQKTSSKKILDLAEDYKREAKALGLKVSGTKGELKTALAVYRDSFLFWDDVYEHLTAGRKVLSESEWRTTVAIRNRVRKHPAASELFKYGKAEQSIFWIDKETGVQCRGRLDWLMDGEPIIVDLKSTTDASPEGFQRSITKYRYYVQAAMYMDAISAINGYPTQFVFAAWEKSMPYASALYYASPDMLEFGRQEYKRLLRIYAECLSKDSWPGYSTDIQSIDLPGNFSPTASPESEQDWLEAMESGG